MKHILIDMRIYNNIDSNEEKEKIGFLPNSIMFTLEELQSEDFPKILSERFKNSRILPECLKLLNAFSETNKEKYYSDLIENLFFQQLYYSYFQLSCN